MISSSGGRRDSFSYVEGGVGGWLRLCGSRECQDASCVLLRS